MFIVHIEMLFEFNIDEIKLNEYIKLHFGI